MAMGRCAICQEPVCESHHRRSDAGIVCVECFTNPDSGLKCVDCERAPEYVCGDCRRRFCGEHFSWSIDFDLDAKVEYRKYGDLCPTCSTRRHASKWDAVRQNVVEHIEQALRTSTPTTARRHEVRLGRKPRFGVPTAPQECPEGHVDCRLYRVEPEGERKGPWRAVYQQPAFVLWTYEVAWDEYAERDGSVRRTAIRNVWLFPDGSISTDATVEEAAHPADEAALAVAASGRPLSYRELTPATFGPAIEPSYYESTIRRNLASSGAT